MHLQKFPCSCRKGLGLKDLIFVRRAYGSDILQFGKYKNVKLETAAQDWKWAQALMHMRETPNIKNAQKYLRTIHEYRSFLKVVDENNAVAEIAMRLHYT